MDDITIPVLCDWLGCRAMGTMCITLQPEGKYYGYTSRVVLPPGWVFGERGGIYCVDHNGDHDKLPRKIKE